MTGHFCIRLRHVDFTVLLYICPIYRAKKYIYVTRSIGCVVRGSYHYAFSYCPNLAGALAVRISGCGLGCEWGGLFNICSRQGDYRYPRMFSSINSTILITVSQRCHSGMAKCEMLIPMESTCTSHLGNHRGPRILIWVAGSLHFSV